MEPYSTAMAAEMLRNTYFRPWGPKLKEVNDGQHYGITPTALDLSKKQTNTIIPKAVDRKDSLEKITDARNSPNLTDINWNPLLFPNPLLIQQIQAYYQFVNNYPLLQQQQQQHHQQLLQQQLDGKTIKQNNISSMDSPVSFPCIPNKGMKLDSLHCTNSGTGQRRGILNIPSPTFSHQSHQQLSPAENHHLIDNKTSPQYPLPSANDGEPLDLLPKSLYMNKAHGGHLCIFCGKLYSRKYGLKIHLRTHTGYKPLKCKVCQRPFGDPSNLNKHIRLHAEGDTPYRCEHCGKVLVRRRDLERHIRSRHPNELQEYGQFNGSPKSSEDDEGDEFDSDIEVNEELDVVG